MDFIEKFIDILIHVDRYISQFIDQFGIWTYLVLFLVIFAETGLVITPFFPGDSLLFAAGAIAAIGDLNIINLFLLLSLAAFLGNLSNYWIGYKIGPEIFKKERSRLFNKNYLNRTHEFYEKHGSITIVIARFMPFIRTFAPFVAGIGKMTYFKFMIYSLVGSVMWVALFLFGGYYFGNISVVKENFSLVIIAIIVISLIPAAISYIHSRKGSKASATGEPDRPEG
ncbi:MAG TPA: DedA family protein [Candidatus Saccharicenans sp.]|nr:DedA family protein [Candidatus Saccharicenans sp.]HOP60705.1 DedA family protein [Candidatus Saccharicenans sp.]HOT68791.1 DedA family protein [Candidatus Saccharicenans sp.]HPC88628.1 DedA family protein [Candidatus Saccharicenans sp.]HPU94109.1 DedA family protein [Candidatus Saccharicenans sp.]